MADAHEYAANLPWFVSRHDESLGTHSKTLADHDAKLAVHTVEIKSNTDDVATLTALVNRVIWALVGLSLTIAGSAAAIALTVSTGT